MDLEEPTPGSPTITDQYLLTDNLGSVDVATTSTGAVVGSTGFSFDAFGKRRDSGTWQMPANGAAVTADRTTVTHRGFTGHEMLDGVGIVDMNGRIYLPTLGRFASVDPVFQFPTNTQSLNPYSYVLNNPLSLTDPTGYASGCGSSSSCSSDNKAQQQNQKSQGYGQSSHRESSRIHEGKANGVGMKLSALGRSVGFVFDNKTKVIGGQLENGAKFGKEISEPAAESKQSGSGGTAAPSTNSVASLGSPSGPNLGATPITLGIGGDGTPSDKFETDSDGTVIYSDEITGTKFSSCDCLVVSSPFMDPRGMDPLSGEPTWHAGIDLAPIGVDGRVFENADALSMTSGTVVRIGANGYGPNAVIVKTPKGNFAIYGHLSMAFVRLGDAVSAGTRIGVMGNEGLSTGIHEHFEMMTGPTPFTGKVLGVRLPQDDPHHQ